MSAGVSDAGPSPELLEERGGVDLHEDCALGAVDEMCAECLRKAKRFHGGEEVPVDE